MKLVTDPDASTVSLSLELCGYGSLLCEAFYEGKKVGEASRAYAEGVASIQLTLSEQHLWQVGKGGLYDLRITFGDDIEQEQNGLCTYDRKPKIDMSVLKQINSRGAAIEN